MWSIIRCCVMLMDLQQIFCGRSTFAGLSFFSSLFCFLFFVSMCGKWMLKHLQMNTKPFGWYTLVMGCDVWCRCQCAVSNSKYVLFWSLEINIQFFFFDVLYYLIEFMFGSNFMTKMRVIIFNVIGFYKYISIPHSIHNVCVYS